MDISATLVKELRELSGAGVMECKRALVETGGDLEEALGLLRELGLSQIAKRSDRHVGQGLVEAYVHGDGRIGVLVELNCETDFVARTPDFRALAHDIALQVAATNPSSVGNEEETVSSADPEDLPLLEQPFIKDPARTVSDLIRDVATTTREHVVLRRFARFELGV